MADLRVAFEKFQAAKDELVAALRIGNPERIEDYELTSRDGSKVRLSELFAGKREMLIVHNMGRSCVYCTLWADGFNGVSDHLRDRAAFVLCSADDATTMREFTEGRGWSFPCVSAQGTSMFRDMGYEGPGGKPHPGVSALRLEDDGTIVRTATSPLGPGDPYCGVWHLFDLLPSGIDGWQPKYSYS